MFSLQHVHPMVVHFPIVFALSLAALDLVATLRGGTVTARTALGNLSTALAVLAGGAAVIAAAFGYMALEIAEAGGWHGDVAEIHEELGMSTAVVLCLWAAVRAALWLRGVASPRWLRVVIPAAELGSAVLVATTAYYGGELVYLLGVNVSHL